MYVPPEDIAKIIGKQGKTIMQIEQDLGMSIDVQELGSKQKSASSKESYGSSYESSPPPSGQEIKYDISMKKNAILIDLGIKMQHKDVNIFLDDNMLLTAKAGKTGVIKIKRNNNIGQMIIDAMNRGQKVRVLV